jgi:hypothetical protein
LLSISISCATDILVHRGDALIGERTAGKGAYNISIAWRWSLEMVMVEARGEAVK